VIVDKLGWKSDNPDREAVILKRLDVLEKDIDKLVHEYEAMKQKQ
jgi:hypothetical protein